MNNKEWIKALQIFAVCFVGITGFLLLASESKNEDEVIPWCNILGFVLVVLSVWVGDRKFHILDK